MAQLMGHHCIFASQMVNYCQAGRLICAQLDETLSQGFNDGDIADGEQTDCKKLVIEALKSFNKLHHLMSKRIYALAWIECNQMQQVMISENQVQEIMETITLPK